MANSELTPLMRQYWDIKSLHPDKVLLFRMGDFFEMFHDDAVRAAPLVGIALTSRNKKSQDETPMCGVPHHSIAGPINKLLKAGLKVAICDQIEDPKLAKGLVKRAVTRILTPGMVYDSETLDASRGNYIAAWVSDILAVVDTSSGEAFSFHCQVSEVSQKLELLRVAELVLEIENPEIVFVGLRSLWTDLSNLESLSEDLKNYHQIASAPKACCVLLAYVRSLSGDEIFKTLEPFQPREVQNRMNLGPVVVRHLEIFQNYLGDTQGSFFEAIDRTRSSGGKRKLRQRISFPWADLKNIQAEQEKIQHWSTDLLRLRKIRESLAGVGDLERRLGRLATPQCSGRDLLSLSQSLVSGISAFEIAGFALPHRIQSLASKIESTLVHEPPLSVRQGFLVQRGVDSSLDEWIDLSTNSHELLQQMEEREKASTGISSLKIRYNNVFGYYIEVTHTHKDKVPSHYLRKQTLANAERFYTDELMELEKKVLSAQTRRFELEYEIFEKLRRDILNQGPDVLKLASELSELDVRTSLAWLGLEQGYVFPKMGGSQILLQTSRHPVVEQVARKSFVANDLDVAEGSCLLLTGPNMAGKSTLMRQMALIGILAQIGSAVPASLAELPVFDAIYTRIGASDQLSQGLSTFMVEMKETAEMLQAASSQSLVILDEVGRGTSTYDGMSLAQAILEYLVLEKKSYIFFATHYHELTSLSEKHSRIHNAHLSVGEKNQEIRFLYTLKKGPAGKSYGIHVGKLAGLPDSVIERATDILKGFETSPKSKSTDPIAPQLSLFDQKSNPQIIDDLAQFSLAEATPLQALNQIAKWQEILSSEL